jgi:hypothetical protein
VANGDNSPGGGTVILHSHWLSLAAIPSGFYALILRPSLSFSTKIKLSPMARARNVSGWPKRCKLAHAFPWGHSCRRLKSARNFWADEASFLTFSLRRERAAPRDLHPEHGPGRAPSGPAHPGGAVKRPSRSHSKSSLLWRFCAGVQGAHRLNTVGFRRPGQWAKGGARTSRRSAPATAPTCCARGASHTRPTACPPARGLSPSPGRMALPFERQGQQWQQDYCVNP